MAIAGGNIILDSTEGMDKISQTEKVTSPYFSDGSTTLAAANIVSSSLSDTNENYFFGISNNGTATTEEFNIAFGSTNGYGSLLETTTKAETEAIYKDQEIYVLSARRSNMKDRLNKGTWQINLSGSLTTGVGNALLHLKDDSSTTTPTATPVGDRYNIVSCSSAGVIAGASTLKNFGFFYPDMGIMVLSQAELSGYTR